MYVGGVGLGGASGAAKHVRGFSAKTRGFRQIWNSAHLANFSDLILHLIIPYLRSTYNYAIRVIYANI